MLNQDILELPYADRLNYARQMFVERQVGQGEPYGYIFGKDMARWAPTDEEFENCCALVGLEYDLFNHCKSAYHISQKFNVSELEIMKAWAAIKLIKDIEENHAT